MTSHDFEFLRHHIDRARHRYRNSAIGFYGAAIVVAALTMFLTGREFYRQGPMVLVGILFLCGVIFQLMFRSVKWDRHPVLVAMEKDNNAIARAQVLAAVGRAARLNQREVMISTVDKASLVLTVSNDELGALAEALSTCYPAASVDGFEKFKANHNRLSLR